jgi:hypothetical protein
VSSYAAFLDRKSQLGGQYGFDPSWVPDWLFDFQRAMVEWACRKGRAALFEDCGLGKTAQQLVWMENVHRRTGRPVLMVAPLAVSGQTIEEASKFGLEVRRTQDGSVHSGLNVTNYERLHLFSPSDWAGCACDESSAIKSFDGTRRATVTDFLRKMEYRLLSTATAAPNDYIELGTSSEALGYLGHMDMLGRFFINDNGNSSHKLSHRKRFGYSEPGARWRFKGHSEQAFWRWVCSWARALRKPSDLGFDDARFVLPSLVESEHLVKANTLAPGMLFDLPAQGLHEERQEQRRTIAERCDMAAALVNGTGEPAVVWCHLNDEGRALARLIPDAVEVSGQDTDDEKESAFEAFRTGKARVLITKPKIGAWGLNWQHCAHMTFFPSHSFEQYYQSVRRCWRFGQTRPVRVDIVTTEGGHDVMQNLKRKAAAAEEMFASLVANMNDALNIDRSTYGTKTMEVPKWLC